MNKKEYRMKNIYFILLVFFIMSIFSGCSGSRTASQEKSNPFTGNWNFIYDGIYSGSTEWKIDPDGQFGVNITVERDSRTFNNYIVGEISETGEVTGSILLSGNRIGSLSGTMKNNIGSGIYKTQRGEGVWSATRR
jgi:hypothetical protein